MSLYPLFRALLFRLPAEVSHDLSLTALRWAEKLKLLAVYARLSSRGRAAASDESVELFGLRFPNRVGLAAGLDKNGDYFRALSRFGFGFVEIGTVTPLPQDGNEKPRMFRLEEDRAIINRMGFNNKGVDYLLAEVQSSPYPGVLGINIGKNKLTAEEKALNDYEICLERVYEVADYVTINVSSPNTPGLRDLQFGEPLKRLLTGLEAKRQQLAELHQSRTPLLVKIAPDMADEDLYAVADMAAAAGMDGLIATNTTIDRAGLKDAELASQAGGLSGAPLTQKSLGVCEKLARHIASADYCLPLVSVGGIMSGNDAAQRIAAGADLVQVYSGFIFRGPELVTDARGAIARSGAVSS